MAFADTLESLPTLLNGKPTGKIHTDLTEGHEQQIYDLTQARPIPENLNIAFQGPTKGGSFNINGELARKWLTLPNPHGEPNSDVIKPWFNGKSIVDRWGDDWIIDFNEISADEAALYEAPFEHVLKWVKPERDGNAEKNTREKFWLFKRSGADMRKAIANISRYIATPEVSKYRVFVWLPATIAPDKNLVVFARDNNVTFGVLQSLFHEIWALRMGTSLEDRPRYTSIRHSAPFTPNWHITRRSDFRAGRALPYGVD